MKSERPLAAVCLTALVSSAAAQSPLCTIRPFAADNGLANGAVVFFDLDVTTAVTVPSIDTNSNAATNTPITFEIYTTPGTWIGQNADPAAWTRVAQDAGGVRSAGRDSVTRVPLASPWILAPGSIGVAIVTDGGHAYTDGDGTNQSFSTNELSIALGAAASVPATGPFTTTALNAPRVWNGCIHYAPAAGLFPSFGATPTVGPSPLNVQFTDSTYTSDPGGITSWAWDFDGDGTVESTARNPSFTYTAGGTYSVSLTVTDASHGSRTRTEVDYIVVDPISASFTATPAAGSIPLTVRFTDTTSGNPNGWRWDFDGDGNVDSTARNPSFTYTTAGTYSVTLITTNGGNADTITRPDLITAVGATNNTSSPSILEYQFNEPRYARTSNTASTTVAPAHAIVADTSGNPTPDWQADPGRTRFMGNDRGSGCLGTDDVAPYGNRIDTGWPIAITGSHTIMFWTRVQNPASASYVFGSDTGSNGRAWFSGSFLSLRSWGNIGSDVDASTDADSLIGWNHWAVVVDDAAGTAQWYLNGVPDGLQVTFPPNTFSYHGANLIVGSYGATSINLFSRYFELDDFRIYGRALTTTELGQAMASENPTTSTFGAGCAGGAGVPQIGASGGAPTATGNPRFAIEVSRMEAGRPAVLNFGFAVRAPFLPYDLSFIPGFSGCAAEVVPDLANVALPNAIGAVSVPLSIPADPGLVNVHVYVQGVVLGSTQGAVTPALDIAFE